MTSCQKGLGPPITHAPKSRDPSFVILHSVDTGSSRDRHLSATVSRGSGSQPRSIIRRQKVHYQFHVVSRSMAPDLDRSFQSQDFSHSLYLQSSYIHSLNYVDTLFFSFALAHHFPLSLAPFPCIFLFIYQSIYQSYYPTS